MNYFEQHMFFCTNQKANGRKCCKQAGAEAIYAYTKERIKALGELGAGKVRVNIAGCLGRCQEGPSLVIYPAGTWYHYDSKEDIDEIIDSHIHKGEVVERLLMMSLAEKLAKPE